MLSAACGKKSLPPTVGVILDRLLKRVAMTRTVAELLARKQRLLEQLHEEHSLNEQDEIERRVATIMTC